METIHDINLEEVIVVTYDPERTPAEANTVSAPQKDLTEEVLKVNSGDVVFEDLADRDTGLGRTLRRRLEEAGAGVAPTGGDIDVNQYQAKVGGEEAVGGTTPTPDQNVVDDLADSVGIGTPDEHPLRTLRMLQQRDAHPWELEPESAEDYEERKD
ncbi:MAG: DUF6335 family protein [Synechococcus sp.]